MLEEFDVFQENSLDLLLQFPDNERPSHSIPREDFPTIFKDIPVTADLLPL